MSTKEEIFGFLTLSNDGMKQNDGIFNYIPGS